MNLKPVDKIKAQLVIITGFLIIALIFDWYYLMIATAILGAFFVFIPVFGDLFIKLWYKFAETIGWVISGVLLLLIYYLVVTPLAFMYRLAGNDPLKLKSPPEKSVFDDRYHLFKKEDIENPW
ncbi:MAG: SxtJ family membrane protein [Balneolaceae bacterium]